MKVLRVISSMNLRHGGPAQGIRNSIPAMKALGISNEVLCFDTGKEDYCGQDNFDIHFIGPSVGPYAFCANLDPWLQSNLNKYDIVIIHGLWLYNSYGTFKTWKALKIKDLKYPKLYIMPHGMLDPYFQNAPGRKIKAMRNSIFWHFFEKKVINGADGVLFTCQRELELARETFKDYSPRKEINVTYGIQPPPTFEKSMEIDFLNKSGLQKGERFILFLSRIHPKKGVDLLINAYLNLKTNRQINLPKLVIAGPLNSSYTHDLECSVKDRSDVIFTDMLQGKAKWGALYLCEAFILPSHQENFGIAVAEALACGKPVLITDKVNIYKEIMDGDAGIVKKDNIVDVQNLLVEWCNTSMDRKLKMNQNALVVYRDKFSIETSAKIMIDKLLWIN